MTSSPGSAPLRPGFPCIAACFASGTGNAEDGVVKVPFIPALGEALQPLGRGFLVKKKGPQFGSCGPTPSAGGVGGRISAPDTLLKPIQYFLFHPAHSRLAELYPFGEHPGGFEAGNVLRAVKDELPELTL